MSRKAGLKVSNNHKDDGPFTREELEEIARRAGWNAVHGPEHLRRGQYRLDDHPPYIYLDAEKRDTKR